MNFFNPVINKLKKSYTYPYTFTERMRSFSEILIGKLSDSSSDKHVGLIDYLTFGTLFILSAPILNRKALHPFILALTIPFWGPAMALRYILGGAFLLLATPFIAISTAIISRIVLYDFDLRNAAFVQAYQVNDEKVITKLLEYGMPDYAILACLRQEKLNEHQQFPVNLSGSLKNAGMF